MDAPVRRRQAGGDGFRGVGYRADEIHTAAIKSDHTTTPNGYDLQISAVTHDTRLTLANAVTPKPARH